MTLALQEKLAELTTPFFEGNKEKAYVASASTLACIFSVLAVCINPRPERAAVPAKKPTLPTFRERFDKIWIPLQAMREEKETKSESDPERSIALKKVAKNMKRFVEKHQNALCLLINDPITLPESGATCDRSDLDNNIKSKLLTCPKTRIQLKASLVKQPATNIDVKNAIDEGLKKYEAEFKKLQEKYPMSTSVANVEQQNASPAGEKQLRPG